MSDRGLQPEEALALDRETHIYELKEHEMKKRVGIEKELMDWANNPFSSANEDLRHWVCQCWGWESPRFVSARNFREAAKKLNVPECILRQYGKEIDSNDAAKAKAGRP